jgi:hypothetical protein
MKKIAEAVGLIACLLYLAVLSCAAQTSPDRSSPQSQVFKVLSKAAFILRQKTAVPPRLPTHIAGLDQATESDLYAIIEYADEMGYSVILGGEPDCKGQHQCSYGTLIGTTRPLSEIDVYDVVDRRETLVMLANGLKGHFYDSDCGSYCSDSLVVWSEGKYHYIIGLKAGSKSDLIRVANSAIRAGIERWK